MRRPGRGRAVGGHSPTAACRGPCTAVKSGGNNVKYAEWKYPYPSSNIDVYQEAFNKNSDNGGGNAAGSLCQDAPAPAHENLPRLVYSLGLCHRSRISSGI
jgi:hypothetical protein